MTAERLATPALIGVIMAALILGFVLGYQSGEQPGLDVLRAENQSLHALLNKAESRNAELLALTDWVDRSSYWTGRHHQCVLDGYSEQTCDSMMDVLMLQETQP